MQRLVGAIDSMLRFLLIAITTIMVICICWQVASRYLTATPSTLTDEVARFLLMWFALLSAAYVLGQRRHLAINLLGDLPANSVRRTLSILLTLVIAGFCLSAMIMGGWRLATETLASGQVTPTLRLPMGMIYLAVPVSGVLMLIYCIDIIRTALGPDALGPNDHVVPEMIAEEL